MEDLQLYIHIPFCVRKCNYCDFLSFAVDDDIKDKYVEALIEEIISNKDEYSNYPISSIFIGGGTPSILKPGKIELILNTIRDNYNLKYDAEITVECNPGTIDSLKISEYKQAGVNRISLGLQSIFDDKLKTLGRIHDYNTFLESYSLVKNSGISNINVDIMGGLPKLTLKQWEDTIKTVVDLRPTHISSYQLIIEEGTPFYNMEKDLMLPDEDTERSMYELTCSMLDEAGYKQYEISNYSLEGYECRHNIGYWIRNNYIGFGLGASSLFQDVRWKNGNDLSKYIEKEFAKEEIEELSDKDVMSEYMFLGLRLTSGISLRDFKNRFKIEFDDINEYKLHTEKMISEGLLIKEGDRLRLSSNGMNLANTVMCGYICD